MANEVKAGSISIAVAVPVDTPSNSNGDSMTNNSSCSKEQKKEDQVPEMKKEEDTTAPAASTKTSSTSGTMDSANTTPPTTATTTTTTSANGMEKDSSNGNEDGDTTKTTPTAELLPSKPVGILRNPSTNTETAEVTTTDNAEFHDIINDTDDNNNNTATSPTTVLKRVTFKQSLLQTLNEKEDINRRKAFFGNRVPTGRDTFEEEKEYDINTLVESEDVCGCGDPDGSDNNNDDDDDDEDKVPLLKDLRRVIVLLMNPSSKEYEVITLLYKLPKICGGEVLDPGPHLNAFRKQIKKSAKDTALSKQKYIGFCRPSDGVEMINTLYAKDLDLEEDEILIAIPRGMKGSEAAAVGKILLSDAILVRHVNKLQKGLRRQRDDSDLNINIFTPDRYGGGDEMISLEAPDDEDEEEDEDEKSWLYYLFIAVVCYYVLTSLKTKFFGSVVDVDGTGVVMDAKTTSDEVCQNIDDDNCINPSFMQRLFSKK